MTPEKTQRSKSAPERKDRTAVLDEVRNLDVWARSAEVLAGYEDDLCEPHILRSID